MTEQRILLFDGVCNLCCFLVKFIIRRDPAGKFKFAALQSLSGKQLLLKSKLSVDDPHSVVYIRDERCYDRSAAILKLVYDLGGFWKMMYVFMLIPPFIRDFLYDVVARTRYRLFGKRSTCMVPNPEIRDRFLDGPF